MHLMTCQPPCKFSNSSTPTHCIPVCQVYSSRGRLDKTHRHFVAFAVCSSHPSVTSDMWPYQRDRQWHLEKCPHVEQSLPSPSVESPGSLAAHMYHANPRSKESAQQNGELGPMQRAHCRLMCQSQQHQICCAHLCATKSAQILCSSSSPGDILQLIISF